MQIEYLKARFTWHGTYIIRRITVYTMSDYSQAGLWGVQRPV